MSDINDTSIGNFLNSSPIVQKQFIPINETEAKGYFENWLRKRVTITFKDLVNENPTLDCMLLNIVSVNNNGIAIVEHELTGRPKHRLIPISSILFIEPL